MVGVFLPRWRRGARGNIVLTRLVFLRKVMSVNTPDTRHGTEAKDNRGPEPRWLRIEPLSGVTGGCRGRGLLSAILRRYPVAPVRVWGCVCGCACV